MPKATSILDFADDLYSPTTPERRRIPVAQTEMTPIRFKNSPYRRKANSRPKSMPELRKGSHLSLWKTRRAQSPDVEDRGGVGDVGGGGEQCEDGIDEIDGAETWAGIRRDDDISNNGDDDNAQPDRENQDNQEEQEKQEAHQQRPKIEKPDGEVGRIKRGGYNLEKTLDWKGTDYKTVKKYVDRLVDKLNIKPFTEQPADAIDSIMDKSTEKFPWLEDYVECWPVADFIRNRLAYNRTHRARIEASRGQSRNRVRGSQGMDVGGRARRHGRH